MRRLTEGIGRFTLTDKTEPMPPQPDRPSANPPTQSAAERKLAAEARKIEAEARKLELDARAFEDESARRRRRSENEKAISDARRSQITALIPDLSAVEPARTAFSGDVPLYSIVAAHRALEHVARRIGEAVSEELVDKSVLITTKFDLASRDAAYRQVRSTLDHLTSRVDVLLGEQATELTGTVAAIASAVPALLSLASADRTIQTSSAQVDEMAAVAAVAAQLRPGSVTLDDFRLVPDAQIIQDALALAARTEGLRDLSNADSTDSNTVQRAIDLIQAIDSFLVSIQAVPAGALRAPLTSAALHESLHVQSSGDAMTRVLLITGATSATQQVIDDKPLWWKDRFSVLSNLSVTYVLLDTTTSIVLKSGVEVGIVQLKGKIGDTFEPPNVV